jgi:hypothetical protein
MLAARGWDGRLPRATVARDGSGTMDPSMSDAMPLELLLGTTTVMQERLADWECTTDSERDQCEYKADDLDH